MLAEQRFRTVVMSTAQAYGITADIVWDDFQAPLVSEPELAKAAARDVAGYAVLKPIEPSMAGEDFSGFASQSKLLFAFIGSNGLPEHHNLHSPRFVGLDDTIGVAASWYVNAALRVLRELER